MKLIKIMIMFVMLIVFGNVVLSQSNPQPDDIKTINTITQEHQNTRKFVSDELTRQRSEFFKMMDDRANYYEETFFHTLNTATWKLGLLFGSIIFFAISINHILSSKLERRRYKKMKSALREEMKRAVVYDSKQQESSVAKNQNPMEETTKDLVNNPNVGRVSAYGSLQGLGLIPEPPSPIQNNNVQQQQPQKKEGFFKRRKRKKAEKKVDKLMKYEESIRKERENLMKIAGIGNAVGFGYGQPPPKSQQQPPQPFLRQTENQTQQQHQPSQNQQQQKQQGNDDKNAVEYKFEVDY